MRCSYFALWCCIFNIPVLLNCWHLSAKEECFWTALPSSKRTHSYEALICIFKSLMEWNKPIFAKLLSSARNQLLDSESLQCVVLIQNWLSNTVWRYREMIACNMYFQVPLVHGHLKKCYSTFYFFNFALLFTCVAAGPFRWCTLKGSLSSLFTCLCFRWSCYLGCAPGCLSCWKHSWLFA